MRISIASLVRKVVLASLTTPLVAAATAACSTGSTSTTSSSGSSGEAGMTEACNGTSVIPLLSGVRLAVPADFLGERQESAYLEPVVADGGTSGDGGPSMGLAWSASFTQQTGTKCKSARDVPACTGAVDALRLLPTDPAACQSQGYRVPGGGPGAGAQRAGCGMSYLVATRADQIVTAVDAAQVRALFGTTDTAEEALYLATLAGYTLSCSESPRAQYKTDGGGYRLVVQRRDGTCNDGITEVVLTVDANGATQEVSSRRIKDPQPCAIGRRPQGLCSEVRTADSALGDFFAHAAHLEAASVHAFRHIGEELWELGADAELLARVESARKDEVRHARVTARLARRFGAKVTRARVSPRSTRTVLDMAIENATEGCVRETYGAIVATWQALAAQDPEVRAAMVGIAKDETEHAQLSWDLAAFFDERLTAEERRVVLEARRHALATLRGSLGEPSASLVAQAGLPTGTLALQLLDDSAHELAA